MPPELSLVMSSPVVTPMMSSPARTAALCISLLIHAMVADPILIFIDKITAYIIFVNARSAYAVPFCIRTPAVITDTVSVLVNKTIVLSAILSAAMILTMRGYR